MPRKCKFDGEWEQALSLLNDADTAQARLRRQRKKADSEKSTADLQPVYGCAPEEAHPSTPPAQKANDSAQISQVIKQLKKARHKKWPRNKHKKKFADERINPYICHIKIISF